MLAASVAALANEQIDSLGWSARAAALQGDYRGADPALAIGVGAIYRHRQYPSLSLEADLLGSVAAGDIGGRDFSLSAASLGLAWRSSGALYLKLRAGVLAEYVEVGGADAWGSGLTGSVGAGWRYQDRLIELELIGLEKAAYGLSLAIYF